MLEANPYQRRFSQSNELIIAQPSFSLDQKKLELLQAVSNTANGKGASPEKQSQVLKIVREIEKAKPPSPNLLSDPSLAKELLDGVWFLQYTSPSEVGDADEFPDAWKPEFASEGESNIETRKFQAQGSVSAAGIKVDTSNRVVQQIFDVENQQVSNFITFDWGSVRVGGGFRQSPNIQNRAIVSFDTALIQLGEDGPKIDISFVFAFLAVLRGSKDNGWLETTFIDDQVRIGRGNKGTMFVLTRDVAAVQP